MPATTGPTKTVQLRDMSGGINRTDARTAIKDNQAYWLENAQPIGSGQVQTLKPRGPVIATLPVTIAKMRGVAIKIGSAETARLITVNDDGSMTAINPTTGALVQIAPPATVTVDARWIMWQDTPLMIGDPATGLFSWDGAVLLHYPVALTGDTHTNTTVDNIVPNTTGLQVGMSISGPGIPVATTIAAITGPNSLTLDTAATATAAGVAVTIGSGAPTSVRDLAVFEGRLVVVVSSRARQFSGPGSYTAWTLAEASLTTPLTDSVFPGSITRILSALELLFIVGPGAIDADSNVQVNDLGITTLSTTNLVADVGTVQPDSIATYLRTFLFRAPYGIYAIVGATPQKLSDSLDGLFQLIADGPSEFSPAGAFALNRVFVWAVLVTFHDPERGARPIILMYARNAWFVGSQGDDLKWITPLVDVDTGQRALWGTDGLHVFQCFAGDGPHDFDIRTKLFDFGAFTQRKQLDRVGVEMVSEDIITATVTVENESGGRDIDALVDPQSTLVFVGTSPLTFVGTSPITFVTSGLSLLAGPADWSGQYLGLRIHGTGAPFVFSAFAFEITPAGEWTLR